MPGMVGWLSHRHREEFIGWGKRWDRWVHVAGFYVVVVVVVVDVVVVIIVVVAFVLSFLT